MLKIGEKAPDFGLEGYLKEKFSTFNLKDFKGRWVVLWFYPQDFSPICTTEIQMLNEKIDDLRKLNIKILGISTDSTLAHQKWAGDLGGLDIALLSDVNKRVTRAYDLLNEAEGIAIRGTIILNPEGIIKHFSSYERFIGRNIDELLRLVAAAQTGKKCPANWQPGEATL